MFRVYFSCRLFIAASYQSNEGQDRKIKIAPAIELFPKRRQTSFRHITRNLAGETGLEPATPGFGDRCSTN